MINSLQEAFRAIGLQCLERLTHNSFTCQSNQSNSYQHRSNLPMISSTSRLYSSHWICTTYVRLSALDLLKQCESIDGMSRSMFQVFDKSCRLCSDNRFHKSQCSRCKGWTQCLPPLGMFKGISEIEQGCWTWKEIVDFCFDHGTVLPIY